MCIDEKIIKRRLRDKIRDKAENLSPARRASRQAEKKRNAQKYRDALKIRQKNLPKELKKFYNIKRSAARRGLECTLTKEWFLDNMMDTCPLTDIKFSPFGSNDAFSMSLDRIDSSKGYTPDNVRFMLKCVNMFKGSMTEEQFLMVAKALADGTQK